MKLAYFVGFVGTSLLAGCSSSSPTSPSNDSGTPDGTVGDANAADAPVGDSPSADGASDAAADSATTDGGDAGVADAAPDAPVGDATCPTPALPSDDPFTIEVGDAGDASATTVLLHAVGAGTQDYTCEVSTLDSGPPYAWTFVGPAAALSDCNGAVLAQHFASEAGAGNPEWLANDGTYVIGQKSMAYTPDGGSGSVPWLWLTAVTTGGGDAGLLTGTQYIERLNTDGGMAPSAATCTADAGGVTEKVPYTADYYFIAP
jgi:Protein of unknown function (DUF3455)